MPQIILAAHGRITTHYKQDIGRGWLHNGIDQGHTNGTAYDLQIMAPADGIVTATGRQGTYGNRLVIRHNDGWRSLLAHHASQLVKVGDRVTQGQIIAVMGNTGTKYVHSHQELWDARGNQYDPLKMVGTSTGAANDTPINISTVTEKKAPMSVLIRNFDGSIGLVTEDGELVPLRSMNEVESLKATGLVDTYVQMADGNVWNTLAKITARKIAQRAATDPATIAAEVAPLVVSAVVTALGNVGAGITQKQVEEAAAKAMRSVFSAL